MATDRNARILIVEDDPGIAQLERRALLRAGYAAEAVASPDEAVSLVASGGFDLAVLDYQLTPLTTGLDLYERLRAVGSDLPAILVTGFSDEGKIIEALRAGVRDVVPKVGEYLDYLPHAVERVLNAVRAEQKLAASEEALRQANEELERRVEERTAELRASERRFRELAENTPDILSRFDRQLRFVFVNPAVERSTGRPAEAFLGKTNREIGLADDLCEMWDGAIGGVFASGEPREIEFAFPSPDGLRHFQSRLVAEVAADGGVEHVLSVARDITALRNAAEELARTKEVAESANRAKDHFLAVLSHELRTPLTPVLTTVQLLERTPNLSPTLREPLAMIRRNVELEARLIDDLLDLTGIARGKLDLHFESVDVHESLLQALEICRRDREAKRISLALDLAASGLVVRADPARLQQLFWNVVKNAVKFTPEGGSVVVRTRDAAGGRLVVEIEDSGIGIEPEAMPHIFDAFEQGGKDVTRLFGGLGLGLAISHALVELHGGAIAATSAGRGRGATFAIELPVQQGVATRTADGAAEVLAAPSRTPSRILLIEDHVDSREALVQLLEIHGHRVESAGSVAAGLALFDPLRFDLVISDLGLPDGSGLDLLRQLRARCDGELKAICLTGFGMEEDVRKSREAGFLAHLTKPVSLQELQAALDRATAGVEVGEPA